MIRTSYMLIGLILPFLAACTSVGDLGSGSGFGQKKAGSSQPRYATYNCGRGQTLVVENFRTSVIVVPPSGESVELMASPPNSRTRYSANQDTLVLDKQNAFWFRTGKTPLDCKR